jgi:hypothetical protein
MTIRAWTEDADRAPDCPQPRAATSSLRTESFSSPQGERHEVAKITRPQLLHTTPSTSNDPKHLRPNRDHSQEQRDRGECQRLLRNSANHDLLP